MSNILDRIVYQSNPLIESRKHMNLTEQRLFGIAMQGLRPKLSDSAKPEVYDLEFHEMVVPPSEISDLLNANGGSIDNLKKSLSTAFQRAHIEIRFGRGGIILRHIFRKLEYEPKEGLLIQLDSELKPYLLDLVHKSYTTYTLRYVFPLSSNYAFRIMELMMQYRNMSKQNPDADDGSRIVSRYFSLEDLRFKLDVPADKYVGRINNLRVKVLEEPIREINEKTPFTLRYETKKEGRNVVGFWLYMVMPAEVFEPPKIAIDTKTGKVYSPSEVPALASALSDASAKKKSKKKAVSPLPQPKTRSRKAKPSEPAPLTVETSGMAEIDFVKYVTHDMRKAGLTLGRIKGWIKDYGVDYTNELFRYGIKQVNRQKAEGNKRTLYLAKCMDNDWLKLNREEKSEQKSINDRVIVSKFDEMQAEVDKTAAENGIDTKGAYIPFPENAEQQVIATDIKNRDLSYTSRRILAEHKMTVKQFYALYMND